MFVSNVVLEKLHIFYWSQLCLLLAWLLLSSASMHTVIPLLQSQNFVAVVMLPALAVTVTQGTECFSVNNDLEKILVPARDCGDCEWCQMLNTACHHSRHTRCTVFWSRKCVHSEVQADSRYLYFVNETSIRKLSPSDCNGYECKYICVCMYLYL